MYTFTQLLSIATALLSTTNALPKQEAGPLLAERAALVPALIGLYVCDDANWKGNCEHLLKSPGVCYTLPDDYIKKISSVGPDDGMDHGASGCTLYETKNCGGEHLKDIAYPGEADLSKAPAGGRYNDFFQSYICY